MTGLRLLTCLLLVSTTASAHTRLELFDEQGRLAYLGSEQDRVDDTRVERTVRYCHLDGRLVFESRALFDTSGRILSIQMIDRQSGRSSSMTVAERNVSFTHGGKSSTVARPAELYVSEGIENFIRTRWASLASGQPEELDLAITQHARTLRFRLVREREDDATLVLRLEPRLWMLRKLAEPVFFHVERALPHRVIETRGPSAVTDAGGELQVLRAVYTRGDPRPLPCASDK